ncbi:hypothetical protein LDENG_00062950, partial [Lucifuga dentata]
SFRIDFKILLLVFKAIHNQAPAYICDRLTFYKPDRCLRSSDRNLLMVPNPALLLKATALLLFVPLDYGIPCRRTSDWLTQYLLSRFLKSKSEDLFLSYGLPVTVVAVLLSAYLILLFYFNCFMVWLNVF